MGLTHPAISRSTQCSTTGVTKGCGIYCPVCGMLHIKEPLLLMERVAYVAAAGFLSRYLNDPLPYV